MATFNIFIDTSIFIKNKFTFHAGPLNSLKKYCQKGYCTLFTNSIILREVEKHIKADVGKLASQAKNAIKKKPELVNAISKHEADLIAEKLLAAPEKLLTQFKTFLDGATSLPVDDLSLAAVFDDYFNIVPPFENKEEKKAEFPDAVAIMSIKRYLQETENATMCVLTDDEGWMAAFEGLENVCIFKDIQSLLTEISKEEALYNQIVQFVGNHVVELSSVVEGWLYEQDCSSLIEGIGPCIECDTLEDLQIGTIIITPHSVDFIDSENQYAVVGFSGTAAAVIDFSYLDHTEEVYDREDHVWLNTIYGTGSIEVNVPFTGTVTVLVSDEEEEMDFQDPKINEIEWDDVQMTVLEMKEHRQNDDPYYCTCPDCGKPIGIHNDAGDGFCTACSGRH